MLIFCRSSLPSCLHRPLIMPSPPTVTSQNRAPSRPSTPTPSSRAARNVGSSTDAETDLVVHYACLTIGSEFRHFLLWDIPEGNIQVYPLGNPISPPSPGPLYSDISFELTRAIAPVIFPQQDFDTVVGKKDGPWHREALGSKPRTSPQGFVRALITKRIVGRCQDVSTVDAVALIKYNMGLVPDLPST